MKKSQLRFRYPLIVAASLLCLGLTIFTLRSPPLGEQPSALPLERPAELVIGFAVESNFSRLCGH